MVNFFRDATCGYLSVQIQLLFVLLLNVLRFLHKNRIFVGNALFRVTQAWEVLPLRSPLWCQTSKEIQNNSSCTICDFMQS